MMNRFCKIGKEWIYTLGSVEMLQLRVFIFYPKQHFAARIAAYLALDWHDNKYVWSNFQVLFNSIPTIQKKSNNY